MFARETLQPDRARRVVCRDVVKNARAGRQAYARPETQAYTLLHEGEVVFVFRPCTSLYLLCIHHARRHGSPINCPEKMEDLFVDLHARAGRTEKKKEPIHCCSEGW